MQDLKTDFVVHQSNSHARSEAFAGSTRGALTLACAWVLVCASLHAGEGVPENALTATSVTKAPLIDGNLDDEAWANVPWTADLHTFPQFKACKFPGHVKIAYDFRNLYIAFETKDPDIQAEKRERDGAMWEDDDLEVFIDAAGRGDHYLEIGVNALNCVYDYLMIRREGDHGPGAFPEITLRGLQTASGRLKDGGWTVEMAIPWHEIHSAPRVPPQKGDVWRINFVHCDKNKDGYMACTLADIKGSHEPKNFLPLIFDGSALEKQREADVAAADQALKTYDPKRAVWRLGEHLDDVEAASSRTGPLPKGRGGYVAKEFFGRVAKRDRPGAEPKDAGPVAVVNIHPSDRDFPDTYDHVYVKLPKLDAEKLVLWYRMDPKVEKALAEGGADGVGLSVEVQEPPLEGQPPKWRRLADVYLFSTHWGLTEITVPKDATLRLSVDRGPATFGFDTGEIALEAEPAK